MRKPCRACRTTLPLPDWRISHLMVSDLASELYTFPREESEYYPVRSGLMGVQRFFGGMGRVGDF